MFKATPRHLRFQAKHNSICKVSGKHLIIIISFLPKGTKNKKYRKAFLQNLANLSATFPYSPFLLVTHFCLLFFNLFYLFCNLVIERENLCIEWIWIISTLLLALNAQNSNTFKWIKWSNQSDGIRLAYWEMLRDYEIMVGKKLAFD